MTDHPPSHAGLSRTASGQVRLAVVMDVIFVGLFVFIGRASHQEPLSPGGLVRTAIPFLVGLVVGWMIVVLAGLPAARWRAGLVVWGSTLVIGMVMRRFTDQGVAQSFIIVAAVFLAVFLIGWRLLAGIRRHHREQT
ncbi:Transmembrane protein [Acidipropionibacterium acidipropionici ATCC 4875]|uniref:Transmembrane protein n=2 Tax=Acidipropionibacterium acidipropionici TaxID=1748 RepID=K7RT13_ACIA4|nr:DUF3054 domain-containing protein [Acidipropionibacterium acidipropionici]AFV89556.1 Transmembrane protein [Acidipropionibacterium acidipropionici ATCC 4875]MDN6557437.1 DUF3054 domain-containing protein [Acidipropionibacterium acidipropionici]